MTLRARKLVLGAGAQRPLRLETAPAPAGADRDEAIAVARIACDGTLLVKLNADEALLLTAEGEAEPGRAAEAVTRLGCRLAIVTLGARGALLRGEADADAPGVPATVVDTTGAGDARSWASSSPPSSPATTIPAAAAAFLPAVVECAARTTEHFGALG